MYRHSTENVLHTKSASVYVREISWRYHMQYVFWKIIPCLLKCFIKHIDLNESQNCLLFHVLLMQFLKLMSALLFTLLNLVNLFCKLKILFSLQLKHDFECLYVVSPSRYFPPFKVFQAKCGKISWSFMLITPQGKKCCTSATLWSKI